MKWYIACILSLALICGMIGMASFFCALLPAETTSLVEHVNYENHETNFKLVYVVFYCSEGDMESIIGIYGSETEARAIIQELQEDDWFDGIEYSYWRYRIEEAPYWG